MTDQISLFNDRLSQQLASLQEEYQRWNNYKTDYDALESLLKTLPDNTTRSAMVSFFFLIMQQYVNYIQ